MTRIITPVQWFYWASVTSNGGQVFIGNDGNGQPQGQPYNTFTEPMPYCVPPDRWLVLTSISFQSKYGGMGRSSYAVIYGVKTLQDTDPSWTAAHPKQGIILPPGTVFNGCFINNEMINEFGALNQEPQNMTFMAIGFLVDHQVGMTRQTCLEGVTF